MTEETYDLHPEPEDYDPTPVTDDPELNRVLVRAVLQGKDSAQILSVLRHSGVEPPEPGRDDWGFAVIHDGDPESGTAVWD